MNDERRFRLSEVNEMIDDAVDTVIDIIDEEQDAFDALPDSFQNSNKGDLMLLTIDKMNDAIDTLNKAQAQINMIIAKKKKKVKNKPP